MKKQTLIRNSFRIGNNSNQICHKSILNTKKKSKKICCFWHNMDNFDPKGEFRHLISLVKKFRWQEQSWKEQSWKVKTGIIFGGCAVFLILRNIYMAISAKIHKRPPQLYGLPVIGSLITMQIWKHDFGRKILPKYGDIVSYNYGITKIYKINDLQLLNAVFAKAVGRMSENSHMFLSYKKEIPILFANSDRDWARRRKIAMTSITKVMNKKELEERIPVILQQITFQELNSLLLKNNNNNNNNNNTNSNNGYAIWYPRECLRNAVFNVIYFASFGKSSMINDDLYKEYNKSITDFVGYGLHAFLTIQLGKIVASIFGFTNGEKMFGSALSRLYQLTEQEFKEITDINVNKGTTTDDYKDTNTIAQCIYQTYVQDNQNGIMDKRTFDRCVADLATLLLAGMDTTGHSTEVGVILLAKHPQIQEKLYKELCNVFEVDNNNSNNSDIGNRFKFTFDKIQKCVFFRAFVNEVLRIACAIPNGLGRTASKHLRCIKWTKNNGKTFNVICEETDNKNYDFGEIVNNKKNKIVYDYVIEPFTAIKPNFAYLCLVNDKVWNKENSPMDLNLNYWLKRNANNGKVTFKNNLNSTPFSVGKRDCLGQSLARKELLAFLANLIVNYKIEAQNSDASSVNIRYKLAAVLVVDPEIPVRISKR